jgi:hypothetical protein
LDKALFDVVSALTDGTFIARAPHRRTARKRGVIVMAFAASAPTSVRKARQMTQEKIYDALQGARTADKVTVYFKDGRFATGALIFNPFKGSGRVIDVDKETSIDFLIDTIRELKLA